MNIHEEIGPLAACKGGEYPDSVVEYLAYYGLNFADENVGHLFGTFESGGQKLVGHIYRPGEYKATVIILHGYMNHCGQLKHLIRYLLREGFAACAYDMHGHGLSSGERGVIEDFARYSAALEDFSKVVAGQVKGPLHVVGFSMGGSVVLEYLLCGREDVFEKVVLCAPLVHNVAWESSKTGCKLYSKFADSVPRAHRKNSSDKEFLKFNRTADVLHVQAVSIKWVKALHEWNKRITSASGTERKIKIIQGGKDTTVAWRYNIKFIGNKFSDVEVDMIAKGRHELLNESCELRNEVFSQIKAWLEG